jgi:hypothetical protein
MTRFNSGWKIWTSAPTRFVGQLKSRNDGDVIDYKCYAGVTSRHNILLITFVKDKNKHERQE